MEKNHGNLERGNKFEKVHIFVIKGHEFYANEKKTKTEKLKKTKREKHNENTSKNLDVRKAKEKKALKPSVHSLQMFPKKR